MSEAFSILLLISLIPLIYEDFRMRCVGVVWLAVAAVAVVAIGLADDGFRRVLINVSVNTALLLLLGLFLAAYLRLRCKRFDRSFGAGDVVFLLCVTPLFAPADYLRFLIAACLVSLVWWVVVSYVGKRITVPFVGMMCLVLAVYISYKIAGIWS